MTVTDHIGEDYKNWDNNIVTIKAGTGRGKSHFVKNALYEYAKENDKKILMLVNRANVRKQFGIELAEEEKTDGAMTILNYQSLERFASGNWGTYSLSEYDYIVVDEMHYFLSDSLFNRTTDISIKAIIDQHHATRIFMSATPKDMMTYLKDKKKLNTIDYMLPDDYDFINSLTYYQDSESIYHYIDNVLAKGEKAIVFMHSAKDAHALHEKYKDQSLFDCSRTNDAYKKYLDIDRLNEMLEKEWYKEQLFITTTANDNGINIKDSNVTTIIIDGIRDIDTIRQCVGRKRLSRDDHETVDIIIKSISNNEINGSRSMAYNRIEMADYLVKHGADSLILKYDRRVDRSGIIYDEILDDFNDDNNVKKKVNKMAYYKCKVDIANYSNMLRLGDEGFNKLVSYVLGKHEADTGKFDYSVREKVEEKDKLELYLEGIVAEKLFKGEQKELIEAIDHRVNGRQQTSYSKLNVGLDILELPYIILPKKSNGKRYWIVEKIDK